MIITEDITNDVQIVRENYDDNGSQKKNVFIEGIFLQSDIKNRNGRLYPQKVAEKAVRQYNEQYINTGRSLGELGHPDTGQINLHLASHKIESLTPNGKNFVGRAKLLDTPMGRIAKTLVEEGVRLGVSLRGYGSLERKGDANIVQEDFVLSTVDIVADPSAPDAFVTGIMENSQKYYQEGLLLEQDYSYIQSQVKKMTKTELTEGQLLKMFESFMKKIK